MPSYSKPFKLTDLAPPVRETFARRITDEDAGLQMKRFGLLINCLEALLKYAAARALFLMHPRGDFSAEHRAFLQRPSLGHFLSILRSCLSQQSAINLVPAIAEVQSAWRSNDADNTAGKALKIRNDNWGHGAILEDVQYAALSIELWGCIESLVDTLLPLIREDTTTSTPLAPLIVATEDGRHFFFNGSSEKGIDYLCYTDASRRLEQTGNPNEVLFRSLFPRPIDAVERSADWFDETIAIKTQSYQARSVTEQQIQTWLTEAKIPSCVVVGEPGFGKTSLMAQIAREKATCYHFFDERSAKTLDIGECFLNLSLQLTERCDLEFDPANDCSPKARSAEFQTVLLAAAAARSASLLIVIDGLDDEWRNHPAKDGKEPKSFLSYLGNPATQPSNVRWLFSTRPEISQHSVYRNKLSSGITQTIPLPSFDDSEIDRFLRRHCPGIDRKPNLIASVAKSSQGSPLYLALFAADFRHGEATDNDSIAVPVGLSGYYDHIIDSISRRAADRQGQSASEVINRLFALASEEGNKAAQIFLTSAKTKVATPDAPPDSLLLIGLYSIVYEALTRSVAAAILDWPQSRLEHAWAESSSVLVPSGDGYAIHHNALRDSMLRVQKQSIKTVLERLADWSAVAESERQYAITWGLRHMCDALEEAKDGDSLIWETRISAVLTSLEHIEIRSKAGQLLQLLNDYARFFSLRPDYGGACPLPVDTYESPQWLTECTEAVVAGEDLHLDHGSGPALQQLRATKKDAPVPPPSTNEERMPCDIIVPQKKSGILEFAEFVRSSVPDLLNKEFNIGQLAENFCADGAVAVAGQEHPDRLGRIRLSNPPRKESRRTLRLHEEPFQWLSADLREGWRWEYGQPDDDDPQPEGIVTVSRYDVWTEKRLSSVVIRIPVKPVQQSAFAVSRDRTRAVIGNMVLDLLAGSVTCLIPLASDSKLAASEDLRISIMKDDGGFNPMIHLVDLRTGLVLESFQSKEVRSIAISRDGRIAAYGAYSGIRLIDTAKRQELPVMLPTAYKAKGVCFSESGQQVGWMETQWNATGYELRLIETSSRRLLSAGEFGAAPEPVALSESECLVLTSTGDVIDTSTEILNDFIGYNPGDGARFANKGRYLHTGYELRHIGVENGTNAMDSSRAPLVLLNKTCGCLIARDDGAVTLREYASNQLLFTYQRSPDDKHFVSDWSADRLDIGRLRGVSVASDQRKALLGFDDGLLYLADLSTGSLQRVNTPDSIRELIGKKYRLFVEESSRRKTSKTVIRRKQGPRYTISKTAISPAGDYAATVNEGEMVRIWSVETGECVAALAIPFGKSLLEGEIDAICFASDSRSLVLLRSDDQVMTWRFLHSKTATILPTPPGLKFLSMSSHTLAEHEGTVIYCDGRSVVSWNTAASPLPTVRTLPEWAYTVRVNLLTRRLLCSDGADRATQITVRDFDSLALIGRHTIRSENVEISNLADDNSFAAITGHRGVEYFTIEEIADLALSTTP